MPRVRFPLSHPRHPTSPPSAATPDEHPNHWDPVPKPGNDPYTPDGNAIYCGSSGFEELKDRAIVSATIEFLDCGPIPGPVPAPTNLAAASPSSPAATASSPSSASASAHPSSSSPLSITFTPVNPRVSVPPSPASSACSCCGTSASASASADEDNDDDEDDSDSSPEYVDTTSPSRKRKRGDQPSRPRKRRAHEQQQHRNHVVLRLQTAGTVNLSLPGSRPMPDCRGVVVSVEESASEDDRCYVAMKPISYSGVTRSASAAFGFQVLDQGVDREDDRASFTLRDVLRVCEQGGLLPFKYSSTGIVQGGQRIEVGCRDWMTQLFCRLHQAGYVSWNTIDAYPENLTAKGFPTVGGTTSFADVISHRYSGRRKQGRRICPKLPYVDPSPITPGHFALEEEHDDDKKRVIRWLEYNGEVLGYQPTPNPGDEEIAKPVLRRSPRLATRVHKG